MKVMTPLRSKKMHHPSEDDALDKDKKSSEELETEKGELLLWIAEEKTLQQVSGNLC